jgi:hypothetical protein
VHLRDLYCFGRPCRLVLNKRRWRCPTTGCQKKTWTEKIARVSPCQVLTVRARAEVTRQIVAAISPQLYRFQDASFRASVVKPADKFDSMVITNGAFKLMHDWADRPNLRSDISGVQRDFASHEALRRSNLPMVMAHKHSHQPGSRCAEGGRHRRQRRYR